MNVIRPNCRIQFTIEDVEFIAVTLGKRGGGVEAVVRLLTDEASRDLILDDERLLHALLEQRGCLRVSSRLYFYVLVRQVFRRSGIDDRDVADYVAELLTEFSRQERTRCVVPGKPEPLDYFFEMLSALQTADPYTRFLIRIHIGNQSLFETGLFPDRIRHRAERRGFPDLAYYESLGQSNFRVARDDRLAQKYALAPIFDTLAERFQATRMALNDMTERLLMLGETDFSFSGLLPPSADN